MTMQSEGQGGTGQTGTGGLEERIHELETAQAVQAAAAVGAQTTQAAGQVGLAVAMATGSVGFIVGAFLGLTIANKR